MIAIKQEIQLYIAFKNPIFLLKCITFEFYEMSSFLSEHFIYILNTINQVYIYLVSTYQCIF